MRAWLVLAIALSPAACLRSTSFKCTSNEQCGASGTCEPSVGYCSFPDPTCGQRFGDSAGALANQCVSASPIDAGPVGDGPHVDASTLVDGGADASTTMCPPDYAMANGYAGHVYKVLGAQTWDQARTACSGPKTFLADPTEPAAISALDTLVTTGSYWVGIFEQSGAFFTVNGPIQQFLVWAPGQPNTTGNSHCVDIAAMGPSTGLMSLGKCGMDTHPAICECDP